MAGLNDCALTIKDCQPNDDVLVRVKYIIADKSIENRLELRLCLSDSIPTGGTIWIVDAHRGDRSGLTADNRRKFSY